MSDLPSISDLLKKSAAPPPSAAVKEDDGAKDASVWGVQKTFEKKMEKVAEKEKEVEAMRFAASLGLPHIDLEKFPITHEALRQLPKEDAEKLQTICFFAAQGQLRFGSLDPKNPDVETLVKNMADKAQAKTMLYVISKDSLNRVLELYGTLPQIKAITKNVEVRAEDLAKVGSQVNNFQALQALIERATITDLLTFLLGGALTVKASDVHVEAEESRVAVRFRLDGMLHDVAVIPKESYQKLVSRIKLTSSLKINITDKPQDGRFTIKKPDGDVDVRVSMLPTIYGESIVMRLLVQSKEGLMLEQLGLRGAAYEKIMQEIKRPNGMIITTGPTGSGKTTTLYSIMHLLNQPSVKIITLEDPVEYKISGVNQSQIDHSKGYTFGSALRSILRQDPDIAMVGEIRDLETAEIAVQAALTGHLILSTIHTNNAFGAIPRFLSMGVKPFLLAPALNCVIGQRLVRRLSDAAKQPATLSEADEKRVEAVIASMPEKIKKEWEGKPRTFYTVPEYDAEGNLGYKGQVGIYEVFTITPEIEQAILRGNVSEYEIQEAARAQEALTMVQDGVLKALDGITSLEEVFRVTE